MYDIHILYDIITIRNRIRGIGMCRDDVYKIILIYSLVSRLSYNLPAYVYKII